MSKKKLVLRLFSFVIVVIMSTQALFSCKSPDPDTVTKRYDEDSKTTEVVTGEIDDPLHTGEIAITDAPVVTTAETVVPDDPEVKYKPKYERGLLKARYDPEAGVVGLTDVFFTYKDNIVLKQEVYYNGVEYILKIGDNLYRAIGDWGDADFEPINLKELICIPSIYETGGLVGYTDQDGFVHDVIYDIVFPESVINNKTIFNYYVENNYDAAREKNHYTVYITTLSENGQLRYYRYDNDNKSFVIEWDIDLITYGNWSSEKVPGTITKIVKCGTKFWRIYLENGEHEYEYGTLSEENITNNLVLDDLSYYLGPDYFMPNFGGYFPISFALEDTIIYQKGRMSRLPESFTTDDISYVIKDDDYMLLLLRSQEQNKKFAYIYNLEGYNDGTRIDYVYDKELTDIINGNDYYWLYDELFYSHSAGSYGDRALLFIMNDGFYYEYNITESYRTLENSQE